MQIACKSAVYYMPLLNRKPADPDTVNTVIVKGLSIIEGANQDYLVMTADMQIYKIIVNIIFATPGLRIKVIPILGFMHFFMDFVFCVGTLISGSSLKSIIYGTFRPVEKMLEGKNIHELRFLTEEIPRPIFAKNELNNMAGLENTLSELAAKTTKAWTELVIKPPTLP